MLIGIDLRLPTYQMGGISQYALHLLPALAELDTDHTFLVLHSRKEKRSFLPEGNKRFVRKNLWTPCHHRMERWTLGAEIAPLKLDVMHSPDFIPPAGGAKRKIITIHDLNFIYYPQFLTESSRRYYLDQIQWAADNADHISADSEATRADIIKLLGVSENKVTTVHLAANSIYKEQFSAEEIAQTLNKYGLQRGFVLFVGTLEPRKNLPMLAKVYKRLREEKKHTQPLILIGANGWETKEIFEAIQDLKLEDNVYHLEGIYDRELAHMYHAAGVLVTPSHYEGFGLPALEAQTCACPVVVSNRGSLPEIVGQRGIMDQVLTDDDLRQDMIIQGQEQAKKFSWKKSAAQTVKIYEGIE